MTAKLVFLSAFESYVIPNYEHFTYFRIKYTFRSNEGIYSFKCQHHSYIIIQHGIPIKCFQKHLQIQKRISEISCKFTSTDLSYSWKMHNTHSAGACEFFLKKTELIDCQSTEPNPESTLCFSSLQMVHALTHLNIICKTHLGC